MTATPPTTAPGGGLPDSIYSVLSADLRASRAVALVTVIEGPHVGASMLVRAGTDAEGSLGDAGLDRVVARDARAELEAGRTGVRHYGPHGETTPEDLVGAPEVAVFVESFSPPPEMWIFGAVDFTAALASVAKVLGYRVTVCDARERFATRRRFPMADEVIVSWPGNVFEARGDSLGPRDAVCILTHDPKFDVPLLQVALRLPAVAYVGAMGSRRTHADRIVRLREAGLSDAEIARLSSPIGLDLGARTPEETAVSIAAEIIARRWGGGGTRLADGDGPIHAHPDVPR